MGLATAFKLSEKNPKLKIALLEKEPELAKHQSGRNSGVIHSGLYYKPGSLKAQNCLNGYKMLLDFNQKHGIPYNICGKVIVATKMKELRPLEHLYNRALQNGLDQVKKLKIEQIREIEPYVSGVMGLYVPYTGIIDFKTVVQKLAELFQQKEGRIFLSEKVEKLDVTGEGSISITSTNHNIQAKLVLNCAGLYADVLARQTNPNLDIRIIPFRGEYYKLKPEKEYLVKSLIYPVLDPRFPFLGVHFTSLLDGGVHAGPNAVFAFRREGYNFFSYNKKEFWESLEWPGFRKVCLKYWRTGLGEIYRSLSKKAFTHALQRLVPTIEEDDLIPDKSGVRAQACHRVTGLVDDFWIDEQPGVINICNAPSPAATSSLSLGDTISSLALKRLA